MSVDMTALLTGAAEGAFEQLGFLMRDLDTDEAAPTDGAMTVTMIVRYRGPTVGGIRLRGDAQLASTIACNMLGDDLEPSVALQQDAIGEMANVICGSILPGVEDPTAVFRLDPPVPEDEAAAGALTRAEVRLRFDGGVAEVALLEWPA